MYKGKKHKKLTCPKCGLICKLNSMGNIKCHSKPQGGTCENRIKKNNLLK